MSPVRWCWPVLPEADLGRAGSRRRCKFYAGGRTGRGILSGLNIAVADGARSLRTLEKAAPAGAAIQQEIWRRQARHESGDADGYTLQPGGGSALGQLVGVCYAHRLQLGEGAWDPQDGKSMIHTVERKAPG